MRSRRLAAYVLLTAVGVMSACGKSPAPGEDVTSSTTPPFTVCYEPDGAPCPPLDAGDDADDTGATDSGDSGDKDASDGSSG
jgi:hypothetical protein